MKRREFLGGASSALVGGLASGPASASPRQPVPVEAVPVEAVDAWLVELDEDLDRMSRRRPQRPVRRQLEAAGLPPRLFGETLAMLTLASAWRDSSEAVRQHPAFARRVIDRAAGFGRDMLALTAWLSSLPRARRRHLGRAMRRPNRMTALLDAAVIRGGDRASPRRRRALRHNFGVVASLIRRRGADDLITGLIAEVDAAASAEGLDPRAVSAAPAVTLAASGDDGDGGAASGRWIDEPATRTGLKLLGFAGGAELVGLLLVAAGIGGSQALLVGGVVLTFGVAPLLLLIGLGFLIAGAVRSGREEEEPEVAAFYRLLEATSPGAPPGAASASG